MKAPSLTLWLNSDGSIGLGLDKAFKVGGVDYITKPFHLEEFLLRVDRLLRRVSWTLEKNGSRKSLLSSVPQTYTFGTNRINFEAGTAHCRCGEIRLTDQEAKLLKLFIARRGMPLSRREILEIGWGYTGGMTTRTVDNFMVRFRKYFEDNPKKPVHFKSVRSIIKSSEKDPKFTPNPFPLGVIESTLYCRRIIFKRLKCKGAEGLITIRGGCSLPNLSSP